MIRLLVLVSAVLALAGNVPVIRDTLRRNARPVAVSWAGWAAIVAIGAAGSAEARQLPSLVYTGLCAAGCGAVAVLALRVPVTLRDDPVRVPLPWGGRARLDLLCLPAAAAGLALLAAARNPGLAIAVSVATDAVLYLPTIGHAWQHPEHESWASYGLFGLGAGAALAAAALGGHAGSMAAAGYLWYLAVADTGVMAIILTRRLVNAAAADPASPSPGQAHEGAAARVPQPRPAPVHHDLKVKIP